MRRLLVVPIVVCVAASGIARTVAAADGERKNRAKTLWKEGIARYNLQRFDQAIDLFERAYEIYPFPNILFNLGQAHRYRKGYEKAIFYYEAYLGEKPGADDGAQVRSIIVDLKQLLEAQKSSDEKPPDGVQAPPAPIEGMDDAEPTNPSPRKLTPPGSTNPLSVTPVSGSAAESAPPWHRDTWGWVLVGSGVIGLGVGGGFVWSSSSLNDEADSADELDVADLRDRARTHETIGIATAAIGGGLLAAGIVKLIVHDGPVAGAPKNEVQVGDGWISVRRRF